jgi:hypothetical protein
MKSALYSLAFLVGLAACPVYGQTTTAQWTGFISDTSGAAVPAAKVTVTNMGTGVMRESTTSDLGHYAAALLPPGNYVVRVEKAGFRTMSRSGVVLHVEQVARRDFTLEIGAISETIDLTAATPLLEASTSWIERQR